MSCRPMVLGLLVVFALAQCTAETPNTASTATTATTATAAEAPVPAADAPSQTCPEQRQGSTADQDAVTVCSKLWPSAPYVRVAENRSTPDGQTAIQGVIEMDITPRLDLKGARVYDRDLTAYDLVDAAGKPLDGTSPLMQQNHLPSNRAHFLIYEVTGKVSPAPSGTGNQRLELTALRPVVLVEGGAIDSRFLGPWEGTVSKRFSAKQWFTDIDNPEHVAKIRVVFAPPVAEHENIGVLNPTPKLPDGTRFETLGKVENATQSVRLSTGECAPALNSYGAANPFPDNVQTSDYSLTIWRYPAMHSRSSVDFHIVFNYPKGLLDNTTSMARDHNFRLKDYIATSTKPKELVFGIHGNPVDQILFSLGPVTGGGGPCT